MPPMPPMPPMSPMRAAVMKAQAADMLCWFARWLADAPCHADVGEGLVAVPLPVLAAVAAILEATRAARLPVRAGFFPVLEPKSA